MSLDLNLAFGPHTDEMMYLDFVFVFEKFIRQRFFKRN